MVIDTFLNGITAMKLPVTIIRSDNRTEYLIDVFGNKLKSEKINELVKMIYDTIITKYRFPISDFRILIKGTGLDIKSTSYQLDNGGMTLEDIIENHSGYLILQFSMNVNPGGYIKYIIADTNQFDDYIINTTR